MGHLTARLSEGWPPPRLLGGRLAVCWVPSPVAIRLMGGHLLGCWVAPRTPDGRPPDNLLGGCPPVLWVAARLLWSRVGPFDHFFSNFTGSLDSCGDLTR